MSVKPVAFVLGFLLASGAGCVFHKTGLPKVIVLGIDGMDPSFVERHWDVLPNLRGLRDHGYFGRLATTAPPQSPVAWSTFITGMTPDEHGIYDFVHRDPATLLPFSSMSRTEESRWVLPIGPYLFPLTGSRVSSLRHGTPFWKLLADRGVPVLIQRMPTNYPPVQAGRALAGMGTPDLVGTQGTFTFFSSDPTELAHAVPGGEIKKIHLTGETAVLHLNGPANPLRKDHAPTGAVLTLAIDPANDVARFKLGVQALVLRQGEWSPWLTAEFPLIPHLSSVNGNVRIFAKQFHPTAEIYVSPININPSAPVLPISFPKSYSASLAEEVGPYFTLGIPEDTAALRQSVLDLRQFQEQAALVFASESRLLDESLREFKGGFMFFYFSTIDQNSHVLWKKHEGELLKVYREVDACIGRVRHSEPDAEIMILSDHGFTSFDRSVHLNAWLRVRGFLTLQGSAGADATLDAINWKSTEAYALGLNGLYLNRKGREKYGEVSAGQATNALVASLRDQLLAWHDPSNGQAIIESVTETHPSPINSTVAPDLIVGYAPGYRASWQTGLGETPAEPIDDNRDAWIGDHCINSAAVPGVLFGTRKMKARAARLQDVTATILSRYGLPIPSSSDGRFF